MHGSQRPLNYVLPALVVSVISTAVGCNVLPRSISSGIVVEEARDSPDLSNLALLQPVPAGPPRPTPLARSRPESPPPAPITGSGTAEGGSVELQKIPGTRKRPPILYGEPAPRPLSREKTASISGPFRAPETLGEELAKEMPERMTLIRVAGLRISVPYSWLADPYSPEAMDFPSPYEFR